MQIMKSLREVSRFGSPPHVGRVGWGQRNAGHLSAGTSMQYIDDVVASSCSQRTHARAGEGGWTSLGCSIGRSEIKINTQSSQQRTSAKDCRDLLPTTPSFVRAA